MGSPPWPTKTSRLIASHLLSGCNVKGHSGPAKWIRGVSLLGQLFGRQVAAKVFKGGQFIGQGKVKGLLYAPSGSRVVAAPNG